MRILILEDDPFTALDLQSIVENEGHKVIGVCNSLAKAKGELAKCQHADTVDFALLDVDVKDGKSYPLAQILDERRIPFAFVSASRQSEMPDSLRKAPFIAKPYLESAIVAQLAGTLEAARYA